jgi:3-dehydroquinate dehydratase I
MICLSIEANNFDECFEIIKTHDFVELRLDKCNFTNEEINIFFSYPIKFIATCRPGFHPDEKRKELLMNAIQAGTEYIDIEIDSDLTFLEELMKLAREYNTKIILSYHNYIETPTLTILLEIIKSCFEKGADIAKIACKVNSKDDCSRIFSLYELTHPLIPSQEGKSVIEHRASNIELPQEGKLIVIGMGDLGRITRIAAPYLGAPFTYASYESGMETADGQIDLDSLTKIYELIK